MQVPFKRLNSIVLDVDTFALNMQALDVFADKYGHQMKTIVLKTVWSLQVSGLSVAGLSLTSHSLAPLKRLTHLDLGYLDIKLVNMSDKSLISLSGLRQIRGITLTGNTKDWNRNISKRVVKNLITNCPKICFIKFYRI
ncbi:unnamed protein product [Medioppia subpectinata]|uniref:Uncharacterized protein n=1 Tax=Medioppia subpectinata TaxID=1979941 RepID=A0A7R9L468_9ACAR|nr:unnamed protein product [Medioppia subpectinata]CAG2115237.1 unnamed protein product [Medioppia subpectinata]